MTYTRLPLPRPGRRIQLAVCIGLSASACSFVKDFDRLHAGSTSVPSLDGVGGTTNENVAGAASVQSAAGAAGNAATSVAGASSVAPDRSRVTPRECAPGLADDTYLPTSTYLHDAQPNVDWVANCARFWFKARAEIGGYYTNVAQDGTPNTAGPRLPITQSRDAYGFVRAFMLTGNEEFLEHAQYALDYLATLWLTDEGGWNAGHDAFSEHYAMLGPTVYCEATQDPTQCGWRDKGEAKYDEKLWDADPTNFGYYSTGGPGWRTPSGKNFNATVDALTTHDYARWLAEPTSRQQRIQDLGENILVNFVARLGTNTGGFGFPSEFSTAWAPTTSYTNFTGHILKASWNLSRLFIALGDDRYRTGAEQTIEEVLTKVWDDSLDYRFKSNGGMPEWWELEQAFTAGILAYYTGRTPELRARYLKLADDSIATFHRIYEDPVDGEAFKTPVPGGTKGDQYKAGYHSTETGYYSLLYGQLFYQHRPVSLYYRIQATPEPRSIALTPIYSPRLRIAAVTLDGAPFEEYGALTRRLDLAAGVGGLFKVTFWIDDTPDAAGDDVAGRLACTLVQSQGA